MKAIVEGHAHVFGDNLDTDQIYPGQYLELVEIDDIKQHAMQGADPDFIKTFKPGDIIIAGNNFGCGSSREQAVTTLKASGTGAIIAQSFARIFYRNAINLGLPLLVCPGIKTQVSTGDAIKIDFGHGSIHNQTSKKTLVVEPLSGYVLEILEKGGIKRLVKEQLALQ
jgi:3-isopropylmalate/(R)-2-methylmalate dehydratase small subunit